MGALLITLNDKYGLQKVKVKGKAKGVVEITVDESSDEEYQEVRSVEPNKTMESVLPTLEPDIIPLLNGEPIA